VETWGDTTHFGTEISSSLIVDESSMDSSPSVSKDYNYDDGDIMIVCSDNVSFRVDSIILKRASLVSYS
jgi:hypothetical protein